MIYVVDEQAYPGYPVTLHVCTDEELLISLGKIEAQVQYSTVQPGDIVEIERSYWPVSGVPIHKVTNIVGKARLPVIPVKHEQ